MEEVHWGWRSLPREKDVLETSTTKPNTQQKIHHPTKHTKKTCNIIPNEKEKILLILLQREMGEVNTCTVKMKEMDEREIANDKRGLVRDKAVDRSEGKTEASVWLEEEVFQSLGE